MSACGHVARGSWMYSFTPNGMRDRLETGRSWLPDKLTLRNIVLAVRKGMQSPIRENRASAGSKPNFPAQKEILDINAAAIYLGVSRSHLSHMLAGKVPGLPAIPHVRAGRRALIRRAVIDDWLLQQEHGSAIGVAR